MHVFEQRIFQRHQGFLCFVVMYMSLNAAVILGEIQHTQFLKQCNFDDDEVGFANFNDVISGAVVPENEMCRYLQTSTCTNLLNPNPYYQKRLNLIEIDS